MQAALALQTAPELGLQLCLYKRVSCYKLVLKKYLEGVMSAAHPCRLLTAVAARTPR